MENKPTSFSNNAQNITVMVVQFARRKGLWIFLGGVVGFCLAMIVALNTKPSYVSKAVLLPKAAVGNNQLSQFAMLAGVNVGAANASNEMFYNDIIHSSWFYDTLSRMTWQTVDGQAIQLKDFLGLGSFEAKNKFITAEVAEKEALAKALSGAISLVKKPEGTMELKVELTDPAIAYQLNNTLLRLIQGFNENERYSDAKRSRQFTQRQLDQQKTRLDSLESVHLQFLQGNKDYSSPSLNLEYKRIARELTISEVLVSELRKQLEVAKIDEEKQRETLKVLEFPSKPIWKEKPKKAVLAVGGVVVGMILAFFMVLVMGWFSAHKSIIYASWRDSK